MTHTDSSWRRNARDASLRLWYRDACELAMGFEPDEDVMAELDMSETIAAFQAQRPRLLQEHGPRWVVFVGAEFKGAFKEFDEAATFAVSKFGDAQFLIRHTEEHIPHVPLVVVEAA